MNSTRPLRLSMAIIVGSLACATASALASEEREQWKAQVEAATARAREARDNAIREFQRSRSRSEGAIDSDRDLENRNSDAVLNDPTLARGDIVSTVDGLFVFTGRPGIEPQRKDFVPYSGPRQH